ncbi:MAG TPA: hypothetical protein EYN91_06030 [Candidatus Melainabacteria bacterium]|jgi:hypothetical protein|nr:hypothetical protein [Candidatus Melainabacteria bacterium]HIN64053.1 hypothetical protein [Candidatus Obscuribacterales bacterium]
MAEISADLKTEELLKLAADNHHKRITLSEEERKMVIDLLKKKGAEELEYGQEIEFETVRLVRRVTGAVGVYFS